MDLSYIKNWLNPFVKKWWYKEEWKEVDSGLAIEILEINGAECSFQRTIHEWKKYRHKSRCDERLRYCGKWLPSWFEDETVFNDPLEVEGAERPKLDELNFTEPYVDAEEG